MNPTIITAPTFEPITRDEAKEHLRVTSSDDDHYIDGLIRAARRQVEKWTGRTFCKTTFKLYRDDLKDGMRLPHAAPLLTVDEIKYLDSAGAEQTLTADTYLADIYSEPGIVWLAYGKSFPAVRDEPNAVRIQYTAGATKLGDVPDEARHAIKLYLSQLYEQREPVVTGTIATAIPLSLEAIIENLAVEAVS